MAIRDGLPQTIPFELTEKHAASCAEARFLCTSSPLSGPHLVVLGADMWGGPSPGLHVSRVSESRSLMTERNMRTGRTFLMPDLRVTDFERAFEKFPVERDAYIVIATRDTITT